jgi:hypothetical protein
MLDALVRASLGAMTAYYWNTGEPRLRAARARVALTAPATKALPIPPPMTVAGKYKRDIHDVGVEHFKVRKR